jgi:hypothetical protein
VTLPKDSAHDQLKAGRKALYEAYNLGEFGYSVRRLHELIGVDRPLDGSVCAIKIVALPGVVIIGLLEFREEIVALLEAFFCTEGVQHLPAHIRDRKLWERDSEGRVELLDRIPQADPAGLGQFISENVAAAGHAAGERTQPAFGRFDDVVGGL